MLLSKRENLAKRTPHMAVILLRSIAAGKLECYSK